jgi:hypothetical protein
MPFGLDENTDTIDFFSESLSWFEGIAKLFGFVAVVLLFLLLFAQFGQWHERKLKDDPAYAARYYDDVIRFE